MKSFPITISLLSSLAAFAFADRVTYIYDAAHRLAKVDYGDKSITYAYDGSGNLLSRTVGAPGVAPSITAAGVVNAASLRGGAVAPGEMVTVFGSGIGPAARTGLGVSNHVASGSVAGARFLFDGVPAPILYVSAGQSTIVVPDSVAGKNATKVVAEFQGVQSAPVSLPVAATSPGLFTSTRSGSGQAAIVNQDSSMNSASSPAPKGSVALLLLTGDGMPAVETVPRTAGPVSVTMGGVEAQVANASVAAGKKAGLTQLKVVVPEDAPSGSAVPIVVTVGGVSSPSGVTIAIR